MERMQRMRLIRFSNVPQVLLIIGKVFTSSRATSGAAGLASNEEASRALSS